MLQKRLIRLSPLALILLATLNGCSTEVAAPTQGLAVAIKGPLANSPFDKPEAAFVALVAEGPDLKADALQVVKPYAPGLPLTLPEVPYGYARQLRVELYAKGVNGQPALPVVGRGRTVPKDVLLGKTFLVNAYVTCTNAFAAAITNVKTETATDGRVGAAIVATADEGVLIAGGADPVAGKTDPHDPASWGNFKTTVLRYDTDLRQLFNLSAEPFNASLSTGRAFMAAARGSAGTIVLSGGYVDLGAGPVPSNLMEYFDATSSKIKASNAGMAHLEFARAHHTVTRMFDDDNYFMVIGGKGTASQASRTWEIWHPTHGRITIGELSGPRWNHAAVRLPEKDGGYMMLIGGENENGPIDNFEVIRYDRFGHVAYKDNPKVTCCLGTNCHSDDKSTETCAALKGQPGYSEFAWKPILRDLAGKVARTMPAAAYVHNGAPRYNLVYIVGGFADAKKTQPLTRVDVFNIETGQWIESTSPLLAPRGAPILGWSTAGAQRGQVIVTGGLDANGKTIATGELLSYDPAGGKVLREWSKNELPGGGMVFGQAASLSTGHVFIAGGASSDGTSLKASTTIRLYNPK